MLLACTILLLGDRDQAMLDDAGLLAEVPDIPDAANSYRHVLAILPDLTQDLENAAGSAIGRFSTSEIDSVAILSRQAIDSRYFDVVQKVNRSDSFQLPLPFTPKESAYSELLHMLKSLVMSAMALAKSGEQNRAVSRLEASLQFAHRIQSEQNHTLMSYQIGATGKEYVLQAIHQLTSERLLNDRQLRRLQKELEQLPKGQQDGMRETFAGEFKFAYEFSEQQRKSMSNARIKAWPYRLWYRYTFHANTTFSRYARELVALRSSTLSTCTNDKKDLVPSRAAENRPFYAPLLPNDYGERYLSGTIHYSRYVEDWCYLNSNVSAVLTLVVLERYRISQQSLPETLAELTPGFIAALPIDPFSRKKLGYSQDRRWIYSAGANGKDNGGGANAVYSYFCDRHEPCRNNPTWPITACYPPSGLGDLGYAKWINTQCAELGLK